MSRSAQLGQQRGRAGQRPPLGQQLAVELAVVGLHRLGVLVGQLVAELARGGARERPPLMPIRRWMRQPSIAIRARSNARCHAKTWA